jgi:hypothetical protein
MPKVLEPGKMPDAVTPIAPVKPEAPAPLPPVVPVVPLMPTVPVVPEAPTVPAAPMTKLPLGQTDAVAGQHFDEEPNGPPDRIWFHTDYLHFWTKGAHVPALVSSATQWDNVTDLKNSMTTLFGDRTMEDGDHEGFRIAVGGWLDRSRTWALEAEYFDLGRHHDDFNSGWSNGTPGLVGPLYQRNPASFLDPAYIAVPQLPAGSTLPLFSGVAGQIVIRTEDYFQSAGMDLRRNFWSDAWVDGCDASATWTDPSVRSYHIDGVMGYRYYRLTDRVTAEEHQLVYDPVYAGNMANTFDDFAASNQFNGAELGLEGTYQQGRWSLDTTARVALGVNLQEVNINGFQTSVLADGSTGPSQNYGALTSPASMNGNEGLHRRNRFVAIPKFSVEAGYQLTCHLKATVGYDVIYWGEVVRAGEQIDTLGAGVGTHPAFAWNTTSYWAQGIRAGGELTY